MKVNIKKQVKSFSPITIELVFETEGEFNAMFNVVTKATNEIWDIAKECYNAKEATSDDWHNVSNAIYKKIQNI
jgi:predicted CopG family antitoxin